MTNRDGVVAAEYSIRARFDDLCRALAERQLEHQLNRPLGYWALAGDRRLPYALLEQRIRVIIQTSFVELAQTPGIGKKKLASLVMLLERAAGEQPDASLPASNPALPAPTDSFSLESVAESHWELWRQTVRTHQLSSAPLGRFAPSLQSIPSVIWNSPLSTYMDTTLAGMRDLKSHGDKRLRGVLEVFYQVHRMLGQCLPARHLISSLRPAFAIAIEQWLAECMPREVPPELHDLRQNLVLPVLNQIESDAGEVVARLITGRLGVESPPESVIEQAERMQVTRARVYQLLDVCADIMAVRWPEGRWQMSALSQRFATLDELDPRREMVNTLQPLLFPTRQRSTVPTEGRALVGVGTTSDPVDIGQERTESSF